MFLLNDFRWDTHNCDPRREDIFNHHGPRSDTDIVSHADTAEDLCVLPNIHIVADDRGVVGITSITADTAVAMDDASFADTGLRIHDDGSEVLQMQIFTETACTDDEAQPGSQAILPSAIPETE